MVLAIGCEAFRSGHDHTGKTRSLPMTSGEPSRGLSSVSPQSLQLKPTPGPSAGPLFARPPGLENVTSTGKGSARSVQNDSIDATATPIAVAKVRIRGLPNALMNDVMIETIMEQANLDSAMVDRVAIPGPSCGEVVVGFSTHSAAKQCVRHFKGRHWGGSGAAVQCEIIAMEQKSVPDRERLMEPVRIPAVPDRERLMEPARIPVAPWLLSPSVPTFEPIVAPRQQAASAEGPLYVPGFGQRHAEVQKACTLPAMARSEMSTDEDTCHGVSEDEVALQLM